jgi:hypothetical protein
VKHVSWPSPNTQQIFVTGAPALFQGIALKVATRGELLADATLSKFAAHM